MGLEGPYPLESKVTLESIRARVGAIRDAYLQLRNAGGERAVYFPFELSDKRVLRPTQLYLSKLPSSLVALFPALVHAAAVADSLSYPTSASALADDDAAIGLAYHETGPGKVTHAMKPFDIDPDVVDRGREGHRQTQQELVERLHVLGLVPLSPKPQGPQYDVAWMTKSHASVAEVKSITKDNEEKQLRLGLGQVLRYRHQVQTTSGVLTVPVLAIEADPVSDSWPELCQLLGVTLVWRGHMDAIA